MKFKDNDNRIENLFRGMLEDGEYIAQELEKTADVFHRHACDLRECAMRQRHKKTAKRSHMNTVERIPVVYAQAVRDCSNDPVNTAASVLSMPPETITAWLDIFVKRDAQYTREKRNRRIVGLARSGLTNKEIGVRVGLHYKSVKRIIKAQFRDANLRAITSGD